jgi:hypothetical protein
MPFSVASRNYMLDQEGGNNSVYMSLHSGDPGSTGANELATTGGSPNYARKPITWAAASGGSKVSNVSEAFDIPPSSTVSYFGLWSAATGGSFRGGGPLSSTETFAAQGTYTVTSGNANMALA